MRHLLTTVLAILLAALLVYWLVAVAEISAAELGDLLRRPSITGLLLIVLCGLVQMACGALKWRAVLLKVAPEMGGTVTHRFVLYYTCLAAVMGQFVTDYAAPMLVRGIATRMHRGLAFTHGAATSLYEQVFDVVVLLAFALPTLAALALGWSLPVWATVLVAFLLLSALVTVLAATRTAILVRAALSRHQAEGRFRRRLAELSELCLEHGLLEKRLILDLYLLSVLRYVAMLARALIIAAFAGIALADIVIAFPIVQATQIVALTPGSLGILEWTWSGLLLAFGHDLGSAGEFALALRILTFLSVLVVLAAAWLAYAARRRPGR